MTDEAKIRKLYRRAAWLKFKRHFVFGQDEKAYINAKIVHIYMEIFYLRGFDRIRLEVEDGDD